MYLIDQEQTIANYGQTVSAVDSSASWVNVSRCEFKSSRTNYLI